MQIKKLALLNRSVLGDQYVRQLTIAAFREILKFIEDNILPFINDKSTSGQDLLNLFFVTFNKYVGKSDKNQAFTSDHIADFMAKMLIHSDGKSNIRQGSCFALADWIKEAKPNVILMNPPYNGQCIHLPVSYVSTWGRDKKEDPSKRLYFIKYIADTINSINHQAKLAVLLPVACAIGTSGEIARL